MTAWTGRAARIALTVVLGVTLVILPESGHAEPSGESDVGMSRQPATAAASPRISGFLTSADLPRVSVPREWWPYARTEALPYDRGTRDASGVTMYAVAGRLYNHPVGQASAGLNLIESYRLNHDAKYLQRAVLNAQRLINTRVESRGGWFYPHPYRFALHGLPTAVETPPWYSAMAQGQALSLFVRLYDVTGKAIWRTAADKTFAALSLPPGTATQPYVAIVDAKHQLWLEEFANPVRSRNDRTWNGMIFAEYGLWDYYRITRDSGARTMFRGVASTVRRYVYTGIRRPSWISAYCLSHAVLAERYHATVTRQYRFLFAITGSSAFAVFHDVFFNDYTLGGTAGTVVLTAGRRTGYTFDANGRITGRKTITLARTSSASGTNRLRIKGRGYYYQITSGPLAGYRVLEDPRHQYMLGLQLDIPYAYARRVIFPAGRIRGWSLSPQGVVSAPVAVTYAKGASATTTHTALINGRLWVLVSSGALAGKYVAFTAVTVH